jgi:hypothetical protein
MWVGTMFKQRNPGFSTFKTQWLGIVFPQKMVPKQIDLKIIKACPSGISLMHSSSGDRL